MTEIVVSKIKHAVKLFKYEFDFDSIAPFPLD